MTQQNSIANQVIFQSENEQIKSQQQIPASQLFEAQFQQQLLKYQSLKQKIKEVHHKYNSTSFETPPLGISPPKDDENQNEKYEYEYAQINKKKLFGSYSGIQNSIKTTRINSNSNQMIERFNGYQKRRKANLQRKAKQLKQVQQQLCNLGFMNQKKKPILSANTIRISKQINNQPLFLRYQKQLEKKQKKIEEESNKKLQKQEQEYQQFLKEYQKYNPKPEQVRDYQSFFDQMILWKQKKQQKVKQEKQKFEKNQMEGVTFKPSINNKSKKLQQKRHDLPIHLREIQPKCYISPKNNSLQLNHNSKKFQK